ncbi:hypothetical protein BDQ12DRAFT_713390 [Crucibulum laeve]|uniref:Uncharacterized protein n=1 Tax=Crucibulum laeve TaxID=68775 RepID=A0A5C3LXF1_9AGAR|nr:hypothetical protein BDQ12DRAFT_713390 [Crucibulum laeve]
MTSLAPTKPFKIIKPIPFDKEKPLPPIPNLSIEPSFYADAAGVPKLSSKKMISIAPTKSLKILKKRVHWHPTPFFLDQEKSAASSHSVHDNGSSEVAFSSFSSGGESHPHKEEEEGTLMLAKFERITDWLSDIKDLEWDFVENYETEFTSDSSSESDSGGEEPFELVEYEGEGIVFRAAVAERVKKVVVDDGKTLMKKMKTKSKHALKRMKNAVK